MATSWVGVIIGLVLAVVIAAALIMLASKLVMGKAASFGSAAIAFVVSSIACFAVNLGLAAVITAVPSLGGVAFIIQIVLNVLVTCAIYTRLLDPKPSFIQAFLILLVQAVIGIIILVVCMFLLMSVFHTSIPGMPDLSQYMQN